MLAKVVPLGLALLAWGLALHTLTHVSLQTQEVPGILPATWWISLAVLLCGSAAAASSSSPRPWLVTVYVGALALVLYGTLPAVLDAPQYAWTYKHIGVVQLLELRGSVSPGVDIYNRWPGFFSAAAALSELMGLRDPVAYAAWFELFSAWINAALVAAVAWSAVRDARVAGLAAVLFTTGDWIGQGYFSPQGAAFPLSLALLLVVVRQFTSPSGGRRVISLMERIVRRRHELTPTESRLTPGSWTLPNFSEPPQARQGKSVLPGKPSRWTAALIVLLLDAAIVATHQLTPYVLLLQLGGLAMVGMLRPRRLLAGMVVITIGYLLPNLLWVGHNYGLFTSLDPFANATAAATTARPVTEPWIDQHAGQLLSLLFLGGAAVASCLLVRRGFARRALVSIVLAVMPVGLLFAQGYGGEASLRVFLFSGPWCATLMAWATFVSTGNRVGRLAAVGLSIAVAALFVPAFFGQTSVNVIPPDEVSASTYFYEHAPLGSVLVPASSDFPLRVGARYSVMAVGPSLPDLLDFAGLRDKQLGAKNIGAIIALLKSYSNNGFVAFSTSDIRYAQVYALTPPGALVKLERAVASSPLFELWHRTPDTRIYRFLGT